MNRCILIAGLFVALAATAPALAQSLGKSKECCEGPRLAECCDDYTRKCLPKIWCLRCGEPYCYDWKPYPCIKTQPCGGPDDYCRKPCPDLCRPQRQDSYLCVPQDGCRDACLPVRPDTKLSGKQR